MAKILIVDDEHLTVELLSAFLTMIGHQPTGALSGRQTWEQLARERPDLILLDIMLPDDNGLNICRKLRETEQTRNVPVIMISAYHPPKTDEANAAGANAYLAKPIDFNALKAALLEAGII